MSQTHLGARSLGQMGQYEGNDVKSSLTSGNFVIRFLAGITSHDNFVIMSRNCYGTGVVFKPAVIRKYEQDNINTALELQKIVRIQSFCSRLFEDKVSFKEKSLRTNLVI